MVKRVLLWITAPLLALIVLIGVLVELWLGRHEAFDRKTAPATVQYEDESPHYAGIVRSRSQLLGRVKGYLLYVGRDPSMGYGHFVRLEWGALDRPVLKEALWDRTGVRARFTSGHEIFVPARYFTFGR